MQKLASSKKWVLELKQFDPILENAARLLEDARLLRTYQRYPSATALAVLSLEETGKYLLSSGEFGAVPNVSAQKSLRGPNHKQKQEAAARMLIDTFGIDQIEALVGHLGYKIELAPKTTANQKTIPDVIGEIKLSDIAAIDIRDNRHVEFILKLLRGEFDHVKQSCFYVDQTEDKLRVPRDAIDRPLSDKVIKLASGSLYVTYTQLRRKMKVKNRHALDFRRQ